MMMKKVFRNYWATSFWLAVALLSVCVAFKLQDNGPNQQNRNFDTKRNNRPPALRGIDRLDANSSDVVSSVSNELDQHDKDQLTKFEMKVRNEQHLFEQQFESMDDADKKIRLAEIVDLEKRMDKFYIKLANQDKYLNAVPRAGKMTDMIIYLKSCYLGINKPDNKLIPLLLDDISANRTTSVQQWKQLLDNYFSKLKKHKVSVSIVSLLAILLGSLSLIPAKYRDNYWKQIKKFFVSKSSGNKSSLNKQHGISLVANTKSPPPNDWWFALVGAALLLLMVGGWILWSRSRNKPIKKQQSSQLVTTETNSTGLIPNAISGGGGDGKSAKQQQKSQKSQHHRSLQKSKKSIKCPASSE